MKCKRKVG